ncbi:MAG: serine/threonine protein kinase [Proteobacteria bacterium]|jgi:eukaryotic-like serine/threonine-protein kinase|nr:serine/threonine protein kinase [Pseudomonadota bacterium]
MSLLKTGLRLRSGEGLSVRVLELIGAGGQGEVYRVLAGNTEYALKWYHHPATELQRTWAAEQEEALVGYLLKNPSPDPRFLWPLDIVREPEGRTFGYLMDLLPHRFVGLEELVLGRVRPVPTLRALCTAAIGLAECFRKLHNIGACYKDINLGGPVIDASTGEVMVCDVDNVRINKTPGNIIFVFFAAPELILNEGTCQTNTDIHSLAVLLFYLFIRHHPLDGARELKVNVFNEVAQRKFYGREPVFIFDPKDGSNRPVPGFHDAAIRNWDRYPQFLKDRFTQAFTVGLHHPTRRVREGEWMDTFSRLMDCLYYCSHCGSENFLDFDRLEGGTPRPCPRCGEASTLPLVLDLKGHRVLLTHSTKLHPHHLGKSLDFSVPLGEVAQHPSSPNRWGLRNLTDDTWTFTGQDGQQRAVPPGRALPLKTQLEVHLGTTVGTIRRL